MIIFCDKITLFSFYLIVKLSWRRLLTRTNVNIKVLDELSLTLCRSFLCYLLRKIGFSIDEERFFAGNLYLENGKNVYISARDEASELALKGTRKIIDNSKILKHLNDKWERNTIFKYIAGQNEVAILYMLLRIRTAESLYHSSYKKREGEFKLIIQNPLFFDVTFINSLSSIFQIIIYPSGILTNIKSNRFSSLLYLVYVRMLSSYLFFKRLFDFKEIKKEITIRPHDKNGCLLVLQEDFLSLDRSYRTQPHWFFEKDGTPIFKTIVLENDFFRSFKATSESVALEKHSIVFVKKEAIIVQSANLKSYNSDIYFTLYKDLWKCAFFSIFCSFSFEIKAIIDVIRLFQIALYLFPFCEKNKVKAFMTCENSFIEADAMQLFSKYLNITTISYQYTNIPKVTPLMLTTADIMITFSPLFHNRLASNGIKPKIFIDHGYLYDSSISMLKERANIKRGELIRKGAKFIIAYLDESVQIDDKYGLINIEKYCSEIKMLIDLVLNNPIIGIVIKTQFKRNSPKYNGYLNELNELIEQARNTGRFIELVHGLHRNTVFPAEAALMSDIVIGHAIGGTAILEAALTGKRCIILNPYNYKSENDYIYKKSNITYNSLEDGLNAINKFRVGDISLSNLGDWEQIIQYFDSYHDGRSGERMRELLDNIVIGGRSYA